MRILKYFLIIIVPILIILGNFRYLVFNYDFYENLYQKSGVYQEFDKTNTRQITYDLFRFFRGKNQLDHNFFSNQAILHLTDVKKTLTMTFYLFYLSLVTTVIISVFLIAKKYYGDLNSALFISSVITIFFIIFLSMGFFQFDLFFKGIHKVLFTNNLWLFPPDDTLIKLFPQEFFIEFANRLAFNIILTSLVLLLLSIVILKIKKLRFD